MLLYHDGGRLRKDVHDIDDDGIWNYLRVIQTSNRKKVPRCQPNKGKKKICSSNEEEMACICPVVKFYPFGKKKRVSR